MVNDDERWRGLLFQVVLYPCQQNAVEMGSKASLLLFRRGQRSQIDIDFDCRESGSLLLSLCLWLTFAVVRLRAIRRTLTDP